MGYLRNSAIFLSVLFSLTTPTHAATRKPVGKPENLARLDAQAAGFSSYFLPNGFKIILAPFPSAADARIELLVKTGSKLEGYGETGMAHLLEHLLFKSAGKRANLMSDLTALGANWNGSTTADRTSFYEMVAADPGKIDEVIRIEADRFIRASFTKEQLSSEMTVVRNELDRSDSSPNNLLERSLERQSFFWHGYSRPTQGARSDIENAPFSALKTFHEKHYRPDNAALIVSGGFDPKRVLALASRLFAEARNPITPKGSDWTHEETRAATSRSELFLSAGKTLVASAWKLPGLTDRQSYAFDLASMVICDDEWGSLEKELVQERKMAASVSCDTHIQPDYSLFEATASAGKEMNADALLQALHQHIELEASKGISQEGLERVRQNFLTSYERAEQSHESLAALLSAAEVAGDWRLYFWQRDTVESITLQEADAALKKWAVAMNRSDVLLRDTEGISAPEMPKTADAKSLVANKNWSVVARAFDPAPTSDAELGKATVHIPLDRVRAKAALISRKTQGDLAWMVLKNDYGNESALAGRKTACSMASALMAYGGLGLNKAELSAKLEPLKAFWSIGLGGIVLEAPRRNFDAALDIVLAAWVSPTLPESEFERIKAATISGIEANQNVPEVVAALSAISRFDNYPDSHPLKPGSLEQQLADSRAVSFADVSACVADFSGIGHIRLAMVGAFSPQDVKAVWAKLEKLPAAKTPYERVKLYEAPLSVDTSPILVSLPDKPNAAIAGSTLLRVTSHSPDFPALRIAASILGGDTEGKVWKRLREQEGLAYSAGVTLSGTSFEPRSGFRIQASAASDKAEGALTILKEELARALIEGFSPEDVERAKRAWVEQRKSALRKEQFFAGTLAEGLETGQDFAWLSMYDSKIEALKAEEVTTIFRKHLADAPMVWMIGRGS